MEGLGLQGSSEWTLSTSGARSNRMGHLIEAFCRKDTKNIIELACIINFLGPWACLPRVTGLRLAPCLAAPTAVWKSLDITGHLWPYMPMEEPQLRRKVEGTRVKNGHLEAADKLIFCRLFCRTHE